MTPRDRAPRSRLLALLVASSFASLTACGDPPPRPPPPLPPEVEPAEVPVDDAAGRLHVAWDPAERASAVAEGRDALVRNQCNRCHTIDDVEPGGRSEHCVSCHAFLDGLASDDRRYRTLVERYGEATIQRYQRNIEHYREVPDLTGIARRIRPEWIADFIAEPEDLRPSLDETMVRTRLTDVDRDAIVRYFAAVAEVADPRASNPHATVALPTPSPERVAAGEQLFRDRGCNVCHFVGNRALGRTPDEVRSAGVAAALAPNLRFTRERMRPELAIQWIRAPEQLHPGTHMPNLHVSQDDAEAIVDFLYGADPQLEPTPPPVAPAVPALLDRPVGWAEVKERVLGRICVHCHMNGHERDPGPGHVGGFGWPAAGLRMRTYETLVAGMPCRDALETPRGTAPVAPASIEGPFCSVLEPRGAGREAPLVEVMLARRDEERRDHVAPLHDHAHPSYASERPGMPMGLPSIPDDEIALVRTWIAQGCPGPTEVTGMPGIPDGFLVPDGPIRVNQGCGVRAPDAERPSWSTQPPPAWWHD